MSKFNRIHLVVLNSVGIGLMILGLAAGKIGYLFQSLEKLKECLPVDGSYITTLLKMIGITYIGQFSSVYVKMPGMLPQGHRSICFADCL